MFPSKTIFSFLLIFITCLPIQLYATPLSLEISQEQNSSNDPLEHNIYIAEKFLKSGKFKNVIQICREILNDNKNDIKAIAYMAASYKAIGAEQQYRVNASLLKNLAPNSPVLYISLAKAQTALKKYQEAETYYIKVEKAYSNSTEAVMGLGEIYLKMKKKDKAATQFEKALKFKKLKIKDYLNANLALCRIWFSQRKYNKVIKRADLLIKKYPLISISYTLMAKTYINLGKPYEALKIYKKLLIANPNSPVPYQELSIIYLEKIKNHEKALEYAEKGVKRFPENLKSLDIAGWVLNETGSPEDALKYLSLAVSKEPENTLFLYHLGICSLKLNNKNNAEKYFKKALQILGANNSNNFTIELKKQIELCK